jgi:hypothetical protein
MMMMVIGNRISRSGSRTAGRVEGPTGASPRAGAGASPRAGTGAGPGLALLLSALAALGACGGPAKSASGPVVKHGGQQTPGGETSNGQGTPGQETPGQQTPGQESPLQGAVVQASGTGATDDEAYAQALTMLGAEVYGDDPWARDSGLAVHDPDRDLIHQEAAGGRVRVLLGLERERVDGLLQELASQPLPPSVPAALSEALASPHGMHMEALACERRLELLDESCEAPRREDIAAELQSLAREIRLRTRLTGGIPLDAENRPLRPLEVVVERVSPRGAIAPLAGVPVMVVQPDGDGAVGAPQARTDATGVARFALPEGEPWPGGIRVVLDVQAFLGPLADMWPQAALTPTARTASRKRWSVVVTERVQGNQARAPIFAASLDRAMRAGGGDPMVALPVEAMRKITTATPATLPRVLPALADELQGRLDVLVVAELDSEYASRMGAYRVWYEARGRVQVYDVWTGKRLAELQDTVTATGVGDERADQAARTQLAEKLATEIAKVPPVTRQ